MKNPIPKFTHYKRKNSARPIWVKKDELLPRLPDDTERLFPYLQRRVTDG